jgi:hypothetical protein
MGGYRPADSRKSGDASPIAKYVNGPADPTEALVDGLGTELVSGGGTDAGPFSRNGGTT